MSATTSAGRVNLMMLSAGLGLGGAETVIRHLAQAIDPQRFNVTIGCIKGLGVVGRQLADEGVDIVSLADPGSQKVDYFTSIKLRRLIRDRGIQLVHTHTPDGLADAAVCKLMSEMSSSSGRSTGTQFDPFVWRVGTRCNRVMIIWTK